MTSRGHKHRQTASRLGFSLIEILVAVTVTAVLIAMMGQILGNSLSAWKLGTRQVDLSAVARAALDIIADDLAATSAHSTYLPFSVMPDEESIYHATAAPAGDDYNTDELRLLAFTKVPAGLNDRTATAIRYYVRESTALAGHYELWRATRNVEGTFNPYDGDPIPAITANRPLAENVAGFKIVPYDQTGTIISNFTVPGQSQPPAWVDVYLALLSQDDAARAKQIFDAPGEEVAVRQARAREYVSIRRQGFLTRVYLRNRPPL